MRKLLENRLLWRDAGGWPSTGRQAVLAGSIFTVLLLGPWLAGVCGCTMFEIGALTLVLSAALVGGSSVYGAITGERERKTLDSLRLTQLSPGQLVLGKLVGEARALGRLLAAGAPALLALALLGGAGLPAFLWTLAVAALAGGFGSVSGLFVSSLAATTSGAVVAGWVLKGLWLVATPVLDVVLRAVLVQEDPVPIFTVANPLAAVTLATIPELSHGAFAWVPFAYVAAMVSAMLAMLWLAARRVAEDPQGGLGIEDGRVHSAWRTGLGPRWLQVLVPGLARNASFLREVAFQSRTGAAAWPGYLVYVVLFLAPFLYARAWAVQNSDLEAPRPPIRLEVSTEAPSDLPTDLPGMSQGAFSHTAYARVEGHSSTLVFLGHRPATCFRLGLYELFGVPMPAGSVQVVVHDAGSSPAPGRELPQLRALDQVDGETLTAFGMAPPPAPSARPGYFADHRDLATRRALQVGLTGTLVLFLLYLAIRCTGFLAGALTGEKDRRSWQDLALSGMPAGQVLSGKLWGALVFTLLQMTVVFPVLSLYVFAGSLWTLELAGLYVYSVLLAVTAGLLGLWSSAVSTSTHQSQGRAAAIALGAWLLGPVVAGSMAPFLVVGAGLVAVAALVRRSPSAAGWLAMTAALAITPQVLSPLTAVVGFMPSLSSGAGGLLSALEVAPATAGLGLVHFLAAVLFLAGAAYALGRGALERVVDREEGSALRAEAG